MKHRLWPAVRSAGRRASWAALMAAFLMPGVASAGCITSAEMTLSVLAYVPDAKAIVYQGDVADRLAALYNATPPATDHPVDRAIVYSTDRLARVLAVLFFHDCRIGAVYLPRDAYLALVGLPAPPPPMPGEDA